MKQVEVLSDNGSNENGASVTLPLARDWNISPKPKEPVATDQSILSKVADSRPAIQMAEPTISSRFSPSHQVIVRNEPISGVQAPDPKDKANKKAYMEASIMETTTKGRRSRTSSPTTVESIAVVAEVMPDPVEPIEPIAITAENVTKPDDTAHRTATHLENLNKHTAYIYQGRRVQFIAGYQSYAHIRDGGHDHMALWDDITTMSAVSTDVPGNSDGKININNCLADDLLVVPKFNVRSKGVANELIRNRQGGYRDFNHFRQVNSHISSLNWQALAQYLVFE